jgi:uncharacterized protein
MVYRPAPSFCGQCGAAWPLGSRTCGTCGQARPASEPAPAVEPGVGRGLFSALLLYFVLLTTLLAPLALAGHLPFDSTEGVLGTFDIVLAIDAVLVVLWSIVHWRDIVPRLRTVGAPRYWVIALAAVPLTVGLAEANVWVVQETIGGAAIANEAMYAAAGYSFVAAMLAIAVQPALIEELAFRGVIFARLQPLLDGRTTVIVTAVMFMVVHLALLSLVFLLSMGLLLGWLRLRSQSLYPGMVLHLLHNTTVLALSWP